MWSGPCEATLPSAFGGVPYRSFKEVGGDEGGACLKGLALRGKTPEDTPPAENFDVSLRVLVKGRGDFRNRRVPPVGR